MGGPVRELKAVLRAPLRRGLDQLVASARLPFEVRSRLRWRQQQQRWIARPPVSSFSGKVRWKMLKDRRPILTTFADKVAVRDYVARVVGPEVLTECYAIVDHPDELERANLPREFVAKSSHASGGVWIVADFAPAEGAVIPAGRSLGKIMHPLEDWAYVLVRPERLDWETMSASFRRWLTMDYSALSVEWAYCGIPPRILVEELLHGPDGRQPDEHKVFVIHGRVEMLCVDTCRFLDQHRSLYLRDWTPLEVRKDVYPLHDDRPPPRLLGRIVEVAEALAQETDFVRVDLYDTGERVVFGELTNYPGAGKMDFNPASYDDELGQHWTLPPRYTSRISG